jgi:hypothetical protein
MYTVSAWDNIYPGLECEHKLFSLSHRRNLESGLERQRREKLFRKKECRNLESVLETKGKIIPEKNAEHKLFKLSHRRNLESGLKKQKGKKFSGKKSDENKLFTVSSPQSGTSFRDKGRTPEKRVININSSPYLIASIWNQF